MRLIAEANNNPELFQFRYHVQGMDGTRESEHLVEDYGKSQQRIS